MNHGLQPLVSVIIPTYNSAKTIRMCLSSVRKQTYSNIEIVVVDNFSSDSTVQIAGEYARVLVKGPERNTQRNHGAQIAKGKYLAFIDSDMELTPTVIQDCVEKCEKEGIDAAIIPELAVGEGFWGECQKLEKLCYLGDHLMEAANRFIRADVYEEVGGYAERMVAGEDFDLHDRLLEGGYRICRINSVIKHHETASFWEVVEKKFYYGTKMREYLRKHPVKGTKRFFLLKPAFLRNWRLLVRDPIHGLGLLFMKTVQWIAGGCGLIKSLIMDGLK